MCAPLYLAFSTIILIVATSAMLPAPPPQVLDLQAKKKDSPAPLKSERAYKIIEFTYMNKIRKSRIKQQSEKGNLHKRNEESEDNDEEMDTYVCRRMARLKRVPMCVRLFDQPHYRDELKIKFSFLAYRGAKPECDKHELAFRTQSMSMYTDVKQEMLLCPGRHHPLRTSWELDDYRDVFYVSSGAVPAPPAGRLEPKNSLPVPDRTGLEIASQENESAQGGTGTDLGTTSARTEPSSRRPVTDSLVVYKREWDADTERFYVYDIIDDFKPKASTLAIVTEYDIEEDLHSMNAISYNNNAAELEVIYIREMFKPLNLPKESRKKTTHLSTEDKIADLSEGELVTLCWVILDQPQYKAIDFDPQPPPKQMDQAAVVSGRGVINFQHSVDYNKNSVKQPMYACRPRLKRISQRGVANANPARIQISSGARPNSYFVYTLHKGKDFGKYNIFEFVENLPIRRGTAAEKSVELPTDRETAADSPRERNTEDFERQFIDIVHKREAKDDIVCQKLKKDQLRTVCVRLFQTEHYAKELGIFFNYRLSIMGTPESSKERRVTIVSPRLQSTVEYHHRMNVCEGRHDILRTDHKLDDYRDLLHVSQGPDTNSVMVFRRNMTADTEWYQVYDIVAMENLLELEESPVTYNHIREEYHQSSKPSYNANKSEIEVIYIRKIFKSPPAVDKLAKQPEAKIVALCYELLDHDPHKPSDFEISRAALFRWRTRIKTYRLEFAHSKEYNDEHPMQPMYPCYGRHKGSQVGWHLDEYLHRYKISAGARPNSYFVYSLLSVEHQQRTYVVYEFVENVKKIEELKPDKIEFDEVREQLIRGKSAASAGRPKAGHPTTRTGKLKRDEEVKDEKSQNTKNRQTGPKSVEPKSVFKNQTPVKSDQNKTSLVRSTPAVKPDQNKTPAVKSTPVVKSNQNRLPAAKSTPTKSDKPLTGVVKSKKTIKAEPEQPQPLKKVIAATPIVQRGSDKQKVEAKTVKPTTTGPGAVAGVVKPINNKERRTLTKSAAPRSAAVGKQKPIETAQEEVPEVLKQVVSEELSTQQALDEPIEMNLKNSEPVEQENISEVPQRVSGIGRKSWIKTDEPPKVEEEKPRSDISRQVISSLPGPIRTSQPTLDGPIEMNLKNSEPLEQEKKSKVPQRVSRVGRRTWVKTDEPIKIEEEKPRSDSRQDNSPSPGPIRITQPTLNQPIETKLENSEPVEHEKISTVPQQGSRTGRKTWIKTDETLKIEEEKPRSDSRPDNSPSPGPIRITQPTLNQPIETKLENSEPVEQEKISTVPQRGSRTGRKTWIKTDETLKIEEEKPSSDISGQEISTSAGPITISQPTVDEPTEMNLKNSEPDEQVSEVLQRVSKIGQKTWDTPPKSDISRQDMSPSLEPISSNQRLARSKSRPTKAEIEMPGSVKTEIETARQRLRKVNSGNQVPQPTSTEPIQTDMEKSEPVKTSGGASKQFASEGFAPPRNMRAGGTVNLKETSDSQPSQTIV